MIRFISVHPRFAFKLVQRIVFFEPVVLPKPKPKDNKQKVKVRMPNIIIDFVPVTALDDWSGDPLVSP
jgi:hypothetical protein